MTPVDTFIAVYNDEAREMVVTDIEATQAPYLVVAPNQISQDGTIFLRGENSGVYAGRESDNSATNHILPTRRIFTWHRFVA